tara:strand:+ start:25964 stop:28021 length:2058 start_codon:yes stop_codon:yes gene_type:complete
MYKLIIVFLVGLIPQLGWAFQQNDSLKLELDEVVVVGYEGNRSIMETPASISSIKTDQLFLFDTHTFLAGMNSLPGIRMEERAPGSYRVSIRGSSLRSPFGVRNVKVYWNGLPFTEPTGSTALNLLGTENISSAEIIKGPAGSVYGAGNGGVLLLNNIPTTNDTQVETSGSVGSFGAMRYDAKYIKKMDGGILQYSYAKQKSDGYRAQSFFDRETIAANGRFTLSPRSLVQITMLYSDLKYGIPGGLNELQFEDNPKQARSGSVEKNSGINHESVNLGATLSYQILPKVDVISSVFTSLSTFDNPFLFDYKRESRKSGGLRSRIYYSTSVAGVSTKITAGSEFQIGETAAQNYGNDAGKISSLNFDDDIRIKSALYFASVELDLKHDFYLTLGASYNNLRYDIERLVTNVTDDTTGFYRTDFSPQIVPRIGLVKKFNPDLSIHASVSFGFSPPTVEEVRTNEGSINLALAPEKGTNFEVGVRGDFWENRFVYDAVFFYFKLNEAIVQQETPRGTDIFRNAGSTNQTGFELSTAAILMRNPEWVITQIELKNALTLNQFYFNNYTTSGGDFSGNELTGVAPATSNTTLTLETRLGVFLNVGHYYTGKIPLNDANSVYASPTHLVKLNSGFNIQLMEALQAKISVSLDNLLDEKYSLGYDINAFGGRYYQPAPSRNWLAGLQLRYVF